MSSNKSAKNKLIELYGEECFIEKLHLRKKIDIQKEEKKYTSKGQYKKMKMLTYHHILERSKRRKSDCRKWSIAYCSKSRMVS